MERRVCRVDRIPYVLPTPNFLKSFFLKQTRMKYIGITPKKETAPILEAVIEAQTPTAGKNFQGAKITNNPLQTSTLQKKSCSIVLALATVTTAEKKPLHKELSLPIYGLPPGIQETIKQVARCYSCSTDYAFAGVLSAVGTAVGKTACLKWEGYTNFPCYWSLCVGNTTEGKTQAVKWLMAPIWERHFEKVRAAKKERAEQAENGTPFRTIEDAIIISDHTPESLYKDLANNPRGLVLYRDELSGMFADFGRYSKSGEVSNLLSIWDSSDFAVSRKTQESYCVEKPFLGMVGGIQPDKLAEVFSDPKYKGNGLFQRFLWFWPDKRSEPRDFTQTKAMGNEAEKDWAGFIGALFNNPQTVFELDSEADQLYRQFCNTMENKAFEADNDSEKAGIYGKLRIQVLRLVLAVAVLKMRDKVTAEDMAFAIDCMGYFEQTALKLLQLQNSKTQTRPLSSAELIRQLNERFKLKDGCQHTLAGCFENLSQTAISLALSGKR